MNDELWRWTAEAGGPPAAVMLDSTHVKAHRSAAGGKGGPTSRRSGGRAADERPRSTPPSTSMADPDG